MLFIKSTFSVHTVGHSPYFMDNNIKLKYILGGRLRTIIIMTPKSHPEIYVRGVNILESRKS